MFVLIFLGMTFWGI